jgi:hypothetical protein
MMNDSIQESIDHALKRLNDMNVKHQDAIDEDDANRIYWSIEGLIDQVQTSGGDIYNGPSLGGTYTRADKQMDDWAREDFARK